jgi:hypothetical protein
VRWRGKGGTKREESKEIVDMSGGIQNKTTEFLLAGCPCSTKRDSVIFRYRLLLEASLTSKKYVFLPQFNTEDFIAFFGSV